MEDQIDIRKAGGVLINDRKFLITRAYGKDFFVAPGGKLDPGETAEQALVREMTEELQIEINPDTLEELGTFYAQAAGHEDKKLEMKVFIIHDFTGELTPSSEVEEMKWINTQSSGFQLGSIFEHDVMPLLKQRGLIE
jgi:8-oxo-dGTP diphosphatase